MASLRCALLTGCLPLMAGSPPAPERAVATDEDAAVLTACSPPAQPASLGALDLGAAGAGRDGDQGFTPGLLTDTPPEGARSGERASGEGLGSLDGEADPVRQALAFEPEERGAGPGEAQSLSIGAMLGIRAGVSMGAGASDEGMPLTAEPASPGAEETSECAWSPPGPDPGPPAPDQALDAAPGQAPVGPQPAEQRGPEHHGACIVRLPPGAVGDPDPNPTGACHTPPSGRLRGGDLDPLAAQQPGQGHAMGGSSDEARTSNPAPCVPMRSAFPCGGAAANGWAAGAAPGELGSDEDEDDDMRPACGGSACSSDGSDGDADMAPGGACELLRDESIEETLVGSFTKLHVSPPGSPPDVPAAAPHPAAWAQGLGAKEP